jgi:hypothetical protein
LDICTIMENDKNIDQLLRLDRQLTAIQKAEIKEHLILYINHLLVDDFNKLIQILYRVDVSEKKLKQLLQSDAQKDAATIIADLLIQRQEEKIRTRETFRSDNNVSGDEKW